MTLKPTMSVVTLIVLLGALPLVLGACRTTAGAGKDISAAGKAIENSAVKHTP
jgi:predicted small secreted protein